MVDTVSAETRSRMMASVRRRDTKPEIAVRKALHAAGFRFRVDVRSLPGSPDIVLARWKTAVFVHGCFWHRHDGCFHAATPATRPEFWQSKFDANVARDRKSEEALLHLGWKVAIVWECGLSANENEGTIRDLIGFIRARETSFSRTEFPGSPPRLRDVACSASVVDAGREQDA
uniref:very short patch repair endonuclease n=1 Tax=Paenirhodobacter enshiensis TaxID=1105367 RepID=UPI0035B36DEF